MKRLFSKIAITAGMMMCSIIVSAQFYQPGDDPGKVRWMSSSTANYQLIYPVGMDSLARVYGRELEMWHTSVGQSAHFLPGQHTQGRIPVVLHGYNAVSNGSVAWAPRRMDLYLSPDAYDPIPIPWERTLAIHEQRHVAQMQAGLCNAVKPLGWFFGEMANGAFSIFYGGRPWMEGDAVATETALSRSGRGRMDSFLNWYMVSFDNDDWRGWFRWRNSSQRHYTLNEYSLGYTLQAGIRYNYNVADLAGIRYEDYSRHLGHPGEKWVLKTVTGKNLREAWNESAHTFYDIWKENADRRKPYMSSETVGKLPSRYTEYKGLDMVGTDLYAVKSGLLHCPSLIRIDKDGKEHFLRPFSATSSGLHLSPDHQSIIWSETVSDPRWSLSSKSIVRSYDIRSGRTRTLSRSGQLYTPITGPDGKIIASEYFYKGGSTVSILDNSDRRKQLSGADCRKQLSGTDRREHLFRCQDGLQIVETAMIGRDIYLSGLSEEGLGIYKVCVDSESERLPQCILQPQPVTITGLFSRDSLLYFTSDRTGAEELHSLDPATGVICLLTSSRYGGRDYQFSEDGKWLYFSASTKLGHIVNRTATDSLPVRIADFSDIYSHPVADTLSAQEMRYRVEICDSVEFSEPVRYRKALKLFNIHSWAPLYVDSNSIDNISFDRFYLTVAPGLTALSQNRLGTAITQLGYSAHPDPDWTSRWKHSGHLRFRYSGWYPVIEANIDFNDRCAHETGLYAFTEDGKYGVLRSITTRKNGVPLISANLSVYIPWSFNRSGWYKGVIPSLSYNFSNDIINTAPKWYLITEHTDGDGNPVYDQTYLWNTSGWKYCKQSISASLRGYIMQNTAPSGVYPRFGVGAEIGVSGNIAPGGVKLKNAEKQMFSPQLYTYVYMYLPGVVRQQGMRLSAKFGVDLNDKHLFDNYLVNTLPRGLNNNSTAASYVCGGSTGSLLLTADYGIPVWCGDLNLGKFASIKRLVLTPHFDWTLFYPGVKEKSGSLYSAGTDVCIDFSTLFFLPYPFSVGVRVDYNGGRSFGNLKAAGTEVNQWYVGPLFSASF